MTEKLKTLYFNPQTGYTGINALARKSHKSQSQVKEFLGQQDTYTLHKPIRRKFERRRVYVSEVDVQWQADLVDMKAYSRQNSGVKYLLTVIDLFSKFAWGIPIKNKSGDEVMRAFSEIFKIRKPKKLQVDLGTEFYNVKVKRLLADKEIELFSVYSDLKAQTVERFNRTLKERMWKVFTEQGTYKWVDIIDDLMTNYNSSYHSSIKMTPIEASKPENSATVYANLYGTKSPGSKTIPPESKVQKFVSPKFQVGDKVRISKYKTVFDKGYLPNFTTEVFFISEVLNTKPVTYKIIDFNKEEIKGIFYEPELVKYDKQDDVYKVESIIRRRTKNGKKEVLVKWHGYSDNFNSWIDESEVQ